MWGLASWLSVGSGCLAGCLFVWSAGGVAACLSGWLAGEGSLGMENCCGCTDDCLRTDGLTSTKAVGRVDVE